MELLERAISQFGVERQKLKCIEELSELIRAISRNDVENIIEELADVDIMINQLTHIYNIDYSKILNIKIDKIKRLEYLLNNLDS